MSWLLGLALGSLAYAALVIVRQRHELARMRAALVIALLSEVAASRVRAQSPDTLASDDSWRSLLTNDVAGHA